MPSRFDRKFLFGALSIAFAAVWLTLAPGARAQNSVPDAMPTGTETWLYSFGVGPTPDKCKINDGADPKGSLTYVTATGLLFGRTSTTTSEGNGDGTIFQINPNGTGYIVDHFFTGAKTDGNDPRHNAMTLVGTVLYGTTLTGGKHDNGSIFSINDDGTLYSSPLLFDFPASAANNAGDQPHSCFFAAGSLLYGMTSQGGHNGGATGDGTIFSFDTSSATYTRLHSFSGKDGTDPHGQPILDPDGKTLYGMTREGGSGNVGVVFSFGLKKQKLKVLHHFACPGNNAPMCIDANDGATPDHGTLVQNNSTLYGLTTYGGKYGNGALFDPHRRQALQDSAELRQAQLQRRHQSFRLVDAQRHHTLRHDPDRRQQEQRHRLSNQYRRHRLRSNLRFPGRQRRGQANRRRHSDRQHALWDDRSGRKLRRRRNLRAGAAFVSHAGIIDAR